jgi:two-component system response regulator HydG
MSDPILVVDDDQSMCEMLRDGLKQKGYEVEWRTSGAEALELISGRDFGVVVSDLNLREMSGLDICKRVTETRPDVPVIVLTAFGDMKSAIEAIRAGAYDFINKPADIEKLAHTIARALSHRELREEVERLTEEVARAKKIAGLLGESQAMKKVFDLIRRVADTDTSVLITGESGTGKELVARALHEGSGRREASFIAVNCAAVPANLLESELFGHARGAFTDAKRDREGLFLRADGGTVLLDEIGEMPAEMQPKLLRVLQERKLRPVGSDREISFDTRIISSTNRDLEAEVEEGRFREDLFYRLNVVQIHVPPLRARGNDILILAQHFLEQVAERMDKSVRGITAEAAKKLLEYDWPGNVRQLENVVERAVTLTEFDKLTVEDLPDKITAYEAPPRRLGAADPEHMLSLAELERRYIEQVLAATDGNKTQAAKVLGLDRRTLYRKLERWEKEDS